MYLEMRLIVPLTYGRLVVTCRAPFLRIPDTYAQIFLCLLATFIRV